MLLRRKFSPGLSRAVNRLLRSLPGIRHTTATAANPDVATAMEKLDAALNNMSHGLCMFGPDNRLLLWNDRYVKMYKLAPDRLRVGCTLDEMLEARKAAGTAYRDLGQYGSKLQTAMTTRSPDNLVAHLDDGRIVNVSYRPTQNGCWVSTHEDITERAQNEARIAYLAFHDLLTGLPNRAAFNERIANKFRSAAGNTSFVEANRSPARIKSQGWPDHASPECAPDRWRRVRPCGEIGLSASPLRPLTRRPTSSCRACPAGSECPFPCR